MELSTLCGLKVNMVIFDESKNRIQEFCSEPDFKVEKIVEMKQKPGKKTRKSLKIKYISNADMQKYMKPEDYGEYGEEAGSDDEHQEVVPNAQGQSSQFFFDDSSNKCEKDTAEAHDVLSEVEDIIE